MLHHKFFVLAVGAIGLAFPSFLLAQGSPDIIWKRQVNVDRVNSVIFSPNGDTLISGGSDRLINLWRVSDGALLQTLNTNAPFVHASAIESLSITPDGSLLASCSYKLIQLWQLPSGAMQRLNGHTDWVVGVAFSPDGNLLASASFDTTVRIWRASDGALLQTLPGIAQQRCVAFSPDGALLAIGGGDKNIRLFRTSDWTLARTLSGHTEDIFVVAFSPDGSTVASGGYDNTVKLWTVADGALKFTFSGNGGNVYGLAYTPDGSKLAYTDGEGNTIKIYRTPDGVLSETFTAEVDAVQTVAVSATGLLGYGRVDETVVLARINTSAAARISSPAPGATFSSPANISIVASPSKAAGSIDKMEFFRNGIPLGEDATSPFSFNWNGVSPGTYALTVVETDNQGATTTSAPVTVTVIDPNNQLPAISISLAVNGSGTVSPLKNGQVLEIGKTYSIKAVAKRDWVFNGWTGSVTNNDATLSFTMTPGMNLTANFVQSPFAVTRGTYTGLIQSTLPRNDRVGFFRIVTTASGSFSGKFLMGGVTYALRGQFKGDGTYSATYPNRNLSIQMQLDLDDNTDQITGSLSDGTFTSALVANRTVYNSKTNPAPQIGRYTVLIPPNASRPTSPQGNGFALLKVDASGNARVSGSLADGTRFSQSAPISKNSTWPFYVSTYRGVGSISGTVTFRDQPAVSDLDGTLNWFRPALTGAKIFGPGFATQTILLGSNYVPSGKTPVLAVPQREENVVVNLANGDLEGELQETATLEPNNQFVVTPSNAAKLRLAISTSSGALKGSFIHPVTGRNTSHRGVVFQKQNLAQGYFLGTDQSGLVSVVPVNEAPQLNTPKTTPGAAGPISNPNATAAE